MTKRTLVEVRQTVAVTVDESKFTPEFMEEFRQSFFPFFDLDDHLRHLAQLHARGIADDDRFIEGYGRPPTWGSSSRTSTRRRSWSDEVS